MRACALGLTARAAGVGGGGSGGDRRHPVRRWLPCPGTRPVSFGRPETVAFLLGRHADPNLASSNALGVAPLHAAVAANSAEIVGMLLAAGANPNVRDPGGNTAVAFGGRAWESRNYRDALLAAGGDLHAKTNDGKTPLDTAIQYGHPEAFDPPLSAC